MKSTNSKISPRGLKAILPHGGLPEAISPYMLDLIEKTGGAKGPLGLQFVAQPEKEKRFFGLKRALDPLNEDLHEIAPGIIYKYRGKINKKSQVTQYGRVLWTITRLCATYCRFCTRGREVGLTAIPSLLGTINKLNSSATIANKFFLSDDEITRVFTLLKSRPEINEVILSGGDPLTAPEPYLTKIIQGLVKLQKEGHIDLIRIGTRLPVHNPEAIKNWHYDLLATIKNPYIMLHINHPAELTDQTKITLFNFRKISLATILAQTVFLKGVNDSEDTLHELFINLTKEGIRPYYLLNNDPVYWSRHFTVPIKRAAKIWGHLRPRLSGICDTAKFIIDVADGYGKVAVPEGDSWNFDLTHYRDFKGKKHSTGSEGA
ncbi:radical SAM protein [Candidatus Peregrinibacteria bacterium]|nr:radical SAM protein [Candidatus Peregrinibacteria bacterium]